MSLYSTCATKYPCVCFMKGWKMYEASTYIQLPLLYLHQHSTYLTGKLVIIRPIMSSSSSGHIATLLLNAVQKTEGLQSHEQSLLKATNPFETVCVNIHLHYILTDFFSITIVCHTTGKITNRTRFLE